MRIATWNVNSLRARLEKVTWWLERARPDVLLMQETKLADDTMPHETFEKLGYQVAHHGEGRWNGVAIASRVGLEQVSAGLGERAVTAAPPASGAEAEMNPLAEARVISAVCSGVRVVSLYAPNGRSVGSPAFGAKLVWYDRLAQWLVETAAPTQPLLLGGDFNVAPTDADVADAAACHGGTHVSPVERRALQRLLDWGLVDTYRQLHPEPGRYTWWDYRAGDFHKNRGMRIDHLLATPGVAARAVAAEIDRECRKGKPVPSDHAPLSVDLDEAGHPFDAGWAGAEERIAARLTGAPKRSRSKKTES